MNVESCSYRQSAVLDVPLSTPLPRMIDVVVVRGVQVCYRAGEATSVQALPGVTFGEAGAHMEHKSTCARYRVQAATATNAVDFMKHHQRLIFAMMGNYPGELEMFRVQQHREGSTE